MEVYRHGDVIIGRIDNIPESAKKRNNVTLAYGETTGHSHRFADPKAVNLFEEGDSIYVKVVTPKADLIHEEHATIALPEGIYRVWQQREYSPKEIRRIVD